MIAKRIGSRLYLICREPLGVAPPCDSGRRAVSIDSVLFCRATVSRFEEAQTEMALAANCERAGWSRLAESDLQHPTSPAQLVAASSSAKAQGVDEARAIIDEQPQHGTEAVALVGVLEGSALIARVFNGRRLWKGWIVAGGFDDREELTRRSRFRHPVSGNRLDDADKFAGGEIKNNLVDIGDLIFGFDHTLYLQASDDLALQRPDAIVKRGCRDADVIDISERLDYVEQSGDGSLDGWY